jgi:hypothetical protein
MAADDDQLRQRLDELDGSRRPNKGRAAVRLDDLNGLLQLPDALKSAKAAGATPTKAEFDLLVEDATMILTKLRSVVAALRARRGR